MKTITDIFFTKDIGGIKISMLMVFNNREGK